MLCRKKGVGPILHFKQLHSAIFFGQPQQVAEVLPAHRPGPHIDSKEVCMLKGRLRKLTLVPASSRAFENGSRIIYYCSEEYSDCYCSLVLPP